MGINNTLKKKFKALGLKNTLRLVILKLLGISSYREEIDTAFYFLDNYVDISNLPPTKNIKLRKLQLGDTKLLKVFDKICKKYNLNYWLDYGTLLGAVRHKGFIPWDDDMDVAMPREDYYKLYELSSEIKDLYNLEIVFCSSWLGFHYHHSQNGLWLDIFPVDIYNTNLNFEEAKINTKYIARQIRKNNKITTFTNVKDNFNKWNELYYKDFQEGHNKIIITGPEYNEDKIYKYDTVYPLKKIKFEDLDFNVPNNCDTYLRELYGNYMKLPHFGIEYHGRQTGRQPLYEWAESNNVNMDDLILELESIYNKI